MKIFDFDVFRQCFNIRSRDTGPFLPVTVGSGPDSYYICYWSAGLQFPLCSSLSRVMDLISIL